MESFNLFEVIIFDVSSDYFPCLKWLSSAIHSAGELCTILATGTAVLPWPSGTASAFWTEGPGFKSNLKYIFIQDLPLDWSENLQTY